MENINCNVITLENNIDYVEVDKIEFDNNTYLFLSNEDNDKDFTIRRLIRENDGEYLQKLSNQEEFDRILKLFIDKFAN